MRPTFALVCRLCGGLSMRPFKKIRDKLRERRLRKGWDYPHVEAIISDEHLSNTREVLGRVLLIMSRPHADPTAVIGERPYSEGQIARACRLLERFRDHAH